MESLPLELLYEMLLPLSYDEIVNYCLTNQAAYHICTSKKFWNLKALQDYGQPLDTIVADTPALQYKIMFSIHTEDKAPLELYIIYRQPQLIDTLSVDQLNVRLNNKTFGALLQQMSAGDWSVFNALVNAFENEPAMEEIAAEEFISDLYMYAVLYEYFTVAAQLSDTGKVLFNDIFWDLMSETDLESFKFFVQDAFNNFYVQEDSTHGHSDLTRAYADNVIDMSLESPDNSVAADPEILKYALDQTYSKAELRELIEHVIKVSPTLLGFLARYYLDTVC